VVKEGRAYTVGGEPVVTLYCFDAVTGAKLWATSVNSGTGNNWGSESTPAIDGDEIFVQHVGGLFYCYDRISGAVKWSIRAGSGAYEGCSPSPLVEGDRIILSGAVLSRTTHQKVFGAPGCAHTSPITTTVNGHHVSLFHGSSLVVCDAAKGTKLCSISGGRGHAPSRHNTNENIDFTLECPDKILIHGYLDINLPGSSAESVGHRGLR
jgi:outer membrane protein assembly factor BamB